MTQRWPNGVPVDEGFRKPAAKGAGARRGFGATWWGQAWVDALEHTGLDQGRLSRGRGYARSGAVEQLEIQPGVAWASVQGSRRTPYSVDLSVREFSYDDWDRAVEAIAAKVGHTAALLDGELPPEVLDDLRAVGLELLPGPGDLSFDCSCPDHAVPCKHAAAVCYEVADRLDIDPFVVFALRGLGREPLLEELRALRGGPAAASPAPPETGVPAALAFRRERPPMPSIPLPPAHPGQPAVLASDPPSDSTITADALQRLAADAAARALSLARGEDTGGLDLSETEDLARRAAAVLGSPGFAELFSRSGLRVRELRRRALAWQAGGRAGLAAYFDEWRPDPTLLEPGRSALGPDAVVRANRISDGDCQFRLGRDGLWYRYVRAGSAWDPDPSVAPDEDPARLFP